ncbi:MAG: LysR substrate-binding domain-containing protein [Planctomycetota bacterium]
MTIRHLEYVVALSEAQSFSRAAERCHVTQPALSTQIQRLETHLGVKLFERGNRQVLLTHAGTQVTQIAQRVLGDVRALAGAAATFANPLAGTLRLGVIPTVAPYFLPRAMVAIRKHLPELRFLVREERTQELVARVQRGDTDLLLLALEAELENLETFPLFEDPFVVAMPPQHPLARRRQIRQRDLAGAPVLLLEDGHCLRDQALPLCESAGACEIADIRATSLVTLLQMVSAGLGLTLIPRLAVDVETRRDRGLVLRPLSSPRPFRTIGLAWRPSSPHVEHYRRLAQLFCKAAPVLTRIDERT